MVDVTISGLRVYPIKSFGGVELSESQVEKRGLRHDRRWMLVDAEGIFLTQRSDTRLALFRTGIGEAGLQLSTPDGRILLVPYEPVGSIKTVQVWKNVCEAVQVCPSVDEWFSDYLGMQCSLVYMPDSSERATHPDFTRQGDIVGFADAFPILVIGEHSLEDLNDRLVVPVPMNRFRPNVIVKGTRPYAEDVWRFFSVGNLSLRFAKSCGRCSVTATDQDTGEVGVEPLRTLATYRLKDQTVLFGAYFVPESEGEVHVGEALRVESCEN